MPLVSHPSNYGSLRIRSLQAGMICSRPSPSSARYLYRKNWNKKRTTDALDGPLKGRTLRLYTSRLLSIGTVSHRRHNLRVASFSLLFCTGFRPPSDPYDRILQDDMAGLISLSFGTSLIAPYCTAHTSCIRGLCYSK